MDFSTCKAPQAREHYLGSTTTGAASEVYEVNAVNEYTSKGGVARAHSLNGNLQDDGARTFLYDYKNRLVGVFDKSVPPNPIAIYTYYSDNRRAEKVVFGAGAATTVFFYDGWQVCEEQTAAGITEATYVYSPVYIDEPVQMVRGGQEFYLHQNARADVVAVTDASGAVRERRFYDDFGRAYDAGKLPVQVSAVGNPYGFQGRRLDAETGLYYFRNRYYDTETGRFLQRDPVWDAENFGGQYSFAWNGPVSGQDARGLQWDVSHHPANPNRSRPSRSNYVPANRSSGMGAAYPPRKGRGGAALMITLGVMAASIVAPQAVAVVGSVGVVLHSGLTRETHQPNEEFEVLAEAALMRGSGRGMSAAEREALLVAQERRALEAAFSRQALRERAFEAKNAAPEFVYRGGPATPTNLTPRPGIDDTPGGGLSTYRSLDKATRPGKKAQKIDTKELKDVYPRPDPYPEGHVTLTPVNPTELKPWADTRPETRGGNWSAAHRLTRRVSKAVKKSVKRPKD